MSRFTGLALLMGTGVVGAALACTGSNNTGPGGGDGGSLDGTVGSSDGGNPGPGADAGPCNPTASGPLGLACPDFPNVAPCPGQDLLTDATKFAALKTAMKSGTLLNAQTPFRASDSNIYKEKCGLEGFWDPRNATQLIPPATPEPDLANLFAPSSNGYAGTCATYAAESASTDGFPAAGTYRLQFNAAYQGTTYAVRARATVSGSAAGQSFAAAGLSDAGPTVSMFGSLVYEVAGAAVPEATLWGAVVDGFSSSATTFPSVTVDTKSGSGPAIWTSKVELLCASTVTPPAAGPNVITVADTITLPGAPVSMAFNAGTKKAYFGTSGVNDAGVSTSRGIAVVDDTTSAVVKTIATPNLASSLAANGTTKKVYASEETVLDVIDSTTDAIAKTVPMPAGGDTWQSLAVDETHDKVYLLASAGSGIHIYVLDGTSNTLGGTPYALTGISSIGAQIAPGNPEIAVDAATQTLFVAGLDASFNAEVLVVDATNGTVKNTYDMTGYQAGAGTAIASLGGGNAVSTLLSSATPAVAIAGQTPTPLSFIPRTLTVCGTSVDVVGADDTGLVHFLSFTPSGTSLGTPTVRDATELTTNGEILSAMMTAAGTGGSGCAYYGMYVANPNSYFTSGSQVPFPPAYIVKLGHP